MSSLTPARCQEIAEAAQRGPEWISLLQRHMTPAEEAEVMQVWRSMAGHTCWFDAFCRLWRGTPVTGG